MKKLYATLFVSAMLASPLAMAATQKMSHEAWIAAQKIDIPPTIKVTETKIPAGSMSSSAAASAQMPAAGQMKSSATMHMKMQHK
ncbi:MAG: hypothetical protein EPN46_06720 [Candidimonas sp.]|nr:MAG: hypothetical protein EPN77_08170 [Candidimonas sp.]TAM26479.1 MAG: hypothetical protein EPN62_01700 [Candidimonas sp.]TAM77336.1 MAG: hypothetical protein EPN46_06720 [Candidimonas sp.]